MEDNECGVIARPGSTTVCVINFDAIWKFDSMFVGELGHVRGHGGCVRRMRARELGRYKKSLMSPEAWILVPNDSLI